MDRAWTSPLLGAAAAAIAFGLGSPRDAQACGGVFEEAPVIEVPGSSSIVRDHRIAIAIGRERTVIWDEVRLAGQPRDFVWITPVKPGTKIELADDEWMTALDVSTQPVVYGPRYASNGCALAGCAAEEDTSTAVPGDSVFVVKEEILGPYDSVTVRAAGDPDAPYRWLVDNGYEIRDEAVRAVLASYAQAGFDFAALKLHAACNQTSMQPVRIVVPGPDPRILLRMALAGARADVVPITLFVLAEAPYRPANYPATLFDDDLLAWGYSLDGGSATYARSSNYDALANDAMAREGKTWLVESTFRAQLAGESTQTPTPGLHEAYDALCAGRTPREATYRPSASPSGSVTATPTVTPPCPPAKDAGTPADAGADADADADAAPLPSPSPSPPSGCKTGSESDYELATRDVVAAPRIYVTRLRARIQPTALAADLELTPMTGPDARDVSNLHQVARYDADGDRPNKRACATSKVHGDRAPATTWALGGAAALALTAWLRRKNRR